MSQSAGAIQQFLIVFDHDAGKLVELIEFGSDSASALREYAAKERGLKRHPRIEIVLVGSDSLETVKRTHANYFERPTTHSRYFDLISSP